MLSVQFFCLLIYHAEQSGVCSLFLLIYHAYQSGVFHTALSSARPKKNCTGENYELNCVNWIGAPTGLCNRLLVLLLNK